MWNRRSPHQVSIIVVSSSASDAKEFRLSRLWYRVLIGICLAGFVSLIGLGALSPYLVGTILAGGEEYPWRKQLAEAYQKTETLTRELEEMRAVAERIRHLAGVTAFEETAPESATEYAPYPDIGLLDSELALGESRLPFLMRETWIPVDETDLSKRQESLFRSIPSIWPVRGWVTDEFHRKTGPLERQHLGLDIAARIGAPVIASGDGIVIFADWDHDLGWLVVIEHGYGYLTRYGHNSSLRVERGDQVRRGQIIALVGNTGRSSASHLHYEVWKHGVPVNPRNHVPEMLRWEDLFGRSAYAG